MSVKSVAWALDRDVENTPGLDATAKLVLLELAEAANKADDCAYIGRPELARAALVSSLRTVDRAIEDLERFGLIEEVDEDFLEGDRRDEYLGIRADRRPKIYLVLRSPRRADSAPRRRAAQAAPRSGPRRAERRAERGAERRATRGAAAAAPEPENQEPDEPVDQLAQVRRVRDDRKRAS